jgi:LacI family transcriptional regulator
VALLLHYGLHGFGLEARGVLDYARTRGNWTTTQSYTSTLRSLVAWPGEGAIIGIPAPGDLARIKHISFPVVTVSGIGREGSMARVQTDNAAIGRLAAGHLLDCGFRRLAFVGRRGAENDAKRRAAFVREAESRGGQVTCATVPVSPRAWVGTLKALEALLEGLQPPAGVMAFDDQAAHLVVEVCRQNGLRVPEEVAVIGVGNNRPVCEFSDPPLSSVVLPYRRIGYRAGRLLESLMAKRRVRREVLLPPEGVAARRSTDAVGFDNPHVRAAVRYMRDHLGEHFGMEQLVRTLPVSQQWLGNVFRETVGCAPYEYLCRMRVARGKKVLLAQPRKEIREIAVECGFQSANCFLKVFRRVSGMSPSQFRKRRRASGCGTAKRSNRTPHGT